ncbi:S-layer homology domain-containing protein [Paenibacillus qinlingensis]|uniref:Histone H3/H4 n=1 Tax=Paenibacillus qinlingensis TaxID=1837343 RepID=A0ABU1P1J9_9BACL|nr:S-layer homology domain-containing protein [Paenibacillus qinlingensis]MDR6553623.1 histone H3/H4 [Paenibacillus qinlingensis]
MKRSLKVIATTTLALSMFASVAMAADPLTTTNTIAPTVTASTTVIKTSKDFTDLKDVDAALIAKIDVLLSKGYMEGKTDTTFDIAGNMTRAEAAKLVSKIFNLTVGTETTSSFSDVDGKDSSIAWSIPFIEAAKKAGIIDGMTDTTFAPKDNVTLGQLATLIVKGLGKTADVKTTTPWYQGYLDVAKTNGVDLGTDGAKVATRTDLVLGSYVADLAVQSLTKLSLTEAKATGVKTVEVKFSKAVEEAAKLELKKGTVVIASTFKLAADKKSAIITLTDLNISQGTYTVAVSGLAVGTVDKATATFEAKNEEVTKIDFVNASESVAQADAVSIKLAATNQYGEKASASASSYTAYATTPGGARVTKSDNGDLFIVVDTKDNTLTANLSSFSVNIYNNDSRVSASKTFKVGLPPMVSKVELGEVKYQNGKDALINAGDQAVIKLVQIDQYGQEITQQTGNAFPVNIQVTPNFNNQYTAVLQDKDNDGIDEVVVTLNSKATVSGEQTITVFGGGSTTTVKVAVKAVSVPAKIEFGELTGSYADGDTDKYVALNLFDAAGNLLSAQDVVDNVDRLSLSASGNIAFGPTTDVPEAMLAHKSDGTVTPIVAVGPNKGKIHLASLTGKGTANIFAYTTITESGTTSNANLSLPITEARYPVTMTVATDPAAKAVETATTAVKLLVKDQYGENLETMANGGVVTENNGTRSVKYDVFVSTSADSNPNIAFDLGNGSKTIGDINDNEYTFTANPGSKGGKTNVTFALRKLDSTSATVIDNNVKSITKEVSVIDPNASGVNLTYSANPVADLFNAVENSIQDGNADSATLSKHAKKVTITAKDASGAVVAVPKSIISVTSNNENIAKVGVASNEAYVIGNKVGTAKVSVSFKTAKGEIVNQVVDVNVKNDPIAVASITADKSTHSVKSFAGVNGTYAYKLMNKLTVKDQYGSEYKSESTTDVVNEYNAILGVQYLISEVKGGNNDTVTLDPSDGRTVRMTAGVTSFVIQAVSPSGKVATTQVVINGAGTTVVNP